MALESAKQFYEEKLAGVQLPEGWSGAVEFRECPGCGNNIVLLHFRNEALGAGAQVSIHHANKVTGTFDNVEEKWAKFAEEDLPTLLERMSNIEEGEEVTSIEVGVARIPGVGFALVMTGGDLAALFRSMMGDDDEPVQ